MTVINTMNPVTIAYHFYKKVQQKYNLREENLLTDTGNEKANQLIGLFEEIVSSHNLVIGTEYILDLREGENENVSEGEDDNTSESEYNNASDSEDDFEDWKHSEKCKYSYEQMQKIVEKSEKMRFNSLRQLYKKLKNPTEVSRIRKCVAKGGTNFHKYGMIQDFVWKKFQLARSRYLPVKDIDLKRWNLQKSKEIKLGHFTGSHEWIRQFKIIMNISSRKITKVISSKCEIDNEKTMEQCCNFVEYSTKKQVNFDSNIIVNSDQSEFNYELH